MNSSQMNSTTMLYTVQDVVQDFLFNPDLNDKLLLDGRFVISILACYVTFCKFLGPVLMETRKAFELRAVLILFNACLVILNGYFAIVIGRICYNFWEHRCGFSGSELFNILINTSENRLYIWHFFLLKHLELLDTVFFVLRKKHRQVSFLHVFHHTILCYLCWVFVKSNNFGFYVLIFSCINCTVHVIMYLYYGLAACGPSINKYLWWKKYLTVIQLMQFLIFELYLALNFFTGCEDLTVKDACLFIFTALVTSLFCNFYIKNFRK